MAKSDALQRQLDNDEPKCASCRHWGRIIIGESVATSGICNGPAYEAWQGGADGSVTKGLVTLDLAVCSKWEAK